jgi:hypothetical protein
VRAIHTYDTDEIRIRTGTHDAVLHTEEMPGKDAPEWIDVPVEEVEAQEPVAQEVEEDPSTFQRSQ